MRRDQAATHTWRPAPRPARPLLQDAAAGRPPRLRSPAGTTGHRKKEPPHACDRHTRTRGKPTHNQHQAAPAGVSDLPPTPSPGRQGPRVFGAVVWCQTLSLKLITASFSCRPYGLTGSPPSGMLRPPHQAITPPVRPCPAGGEPRQVPLPPSSPRPHRLVLRSTCPSRHQTTAPVLFVRNTSGGRYTPQHQPSEARGSKGIAGVNPVVFPPHPSEPANISPTAGFEFLPLSPPTISTGTNSKPHTGNLRRHGDAGV